MAEIDTSVTLPKTNRDRSHKGMLMMAEAAAIAGVTCNKGRGMLSETNRSHNRSTTPRRMDIGTGMADSKVGVILTKTKSHRSRDSPGSPWTTTTSVNRGAMWPATRDTGRSSRTRMVSIRTNRE